MELTLDQSKIIISALLTQVEELQATIIGRNLTISDYQERNRELVEVEQECNRLNNLVGRLDSEKKESVKVLEAMRKELEAQTTKNVELMKEVDSYKQRLEFFVRFLPENCSLNCVNNGRCIECPNYKELRTAK